MTFGRAPTLILCCDFLPLFGWAERCIIWANARHAKKTNNIQHHSVSVSISITETIHPDETEYVCGFPANPLSVSLMLMLMRMPMLMIMMMMRRRRKTMKIVKMMKMMRMTRTRTRITTHTRVRKEKEGRKEGTREREKERRIEKWKYGKESDQSMPPSLLLPLLLSSPLCWLPSSVDLQGSNSWVSEFQRKPEHHPQDWYRCNLTFWYGAGNGRCLPVRVQSSNRILFIFQPIARTKTHRISFFQFLYPAEALVRGTLQNPSPLQPVLFKWLSKEQPNLKQPAPSWYHGTYRISIYWQCLMNIWIWHDTNVIQYNLCDIWYNLI